MGTDTLPWDVWAAFPAGAEPCSSTRPGSHPFLVSALLSLGLLGCVWGNGGEIVLGSRGNFGWECCGPQRDLDVLQRGVVFPNSHYVIA